MPDADANVPTWVNVVVPLALLTLFVLVLVWTTFTKWEISYETTERWVKRLGLAKIQKVIDKASAKKPENSKNTTNTVNVRKTSDRTNSTHVKSYGSLISDFSRSSYKSGYSNTSFYVYETNV